MPVSIRNHVEDKSVRQLLKEEKDARREWYDHFDGGSPKKPYSSEARASLRKLEKAKAALVSATGAPNFKEAAKKLQYSPQYALRTSPIDYSTRGRLAFVTLNRPERLNAIGAGMTAGLRQAVERANREHEVRVIILRGAGRAFCAGYDLQGAPQAEANAQERTGGWDPVADYAFMSENVRNFMSLWESRKPVIAQVHGWCVGGGTDMALCSDLIFMADDARIGYPPSRIWGTPTTNMWVFRLGLENAKRIMLTGESLDGPEAVRLGLASTSVPAVQLQEEVETFAEKLATTPANQLAMNKLLVNQTYENMGLRTTQTLGTFFDGIARHTPEGLAWRDLAMKEGFQEAVRQRDEPWADYGSRPKD